MENINRSIMKKTESIIELLKDDEYYYNGEGRKLLSVSNMGLLTNTPELFIEFLSGSYKKPTTTPMIIGGAFHNMVLEGMDFFTDKWNVIDIKTRAAAKFKDDVGDNKLTLPEFNKMMRWNEVLQAKSAVDVDIFNLVEEFIGEIEVPNTIQIHGVDWKGKADKLTDDLVYDLKTTANLKKFKWSAYDYNYDCQAYLYGKMFNREVKFIVIDKETLQVAVVDCDAGFLESGRDKIERASLFYRDIILPTIEGKEDKVSSLINYFTL